MIVCCGYEALRDNACVDETILAIGLEVFSFSNFSFEVQDFFYISKMDLSISALTSGGLLERLLRC